MNINTTKRKKMKKLIIKIDSEQAAEEIKILSSYGVSGRKKQMLITLDYEDQNLAEPSNFFLAMESEKTVTLEFSSTLTGNSYIEGFLFAGEILSNEMEDMTQCSNEEVIENFKEGIEETIKSNLFNNEEDVKIIFEWGQHVL